MEAIFVTGGSGFIGKRLIRQLAKNDVFIYLLARPQTMEKTQNFLRGLEPKYKVKILLGDLRLKNLGIKPRHLKEIKDKTTIIYHLGAKFDVDSPREEAETTNVLGTSNVLTLASQMRELKTFCYVSTAYVCGLREGVIFEDELIPPSGFRNFYEESKFEAEKLVRQYSHRLPIIIFRPSQVVGDSKTGETDKFNGPYKLIKIISQGKLLFLPGPCQAPFNIVPVNFVVNAIITISSQKKNIGKALHLCDPHPLTAVEFINLTCDLLKVRRPFFRIPLPFLRAILGVPYLEKYVKIGGSSAFLNQDLIFDTSNMVGALRETKLWVPKIKDYLPNILRFFKKNEQILTS